MVYMALPTEVQTAAIIAVALRQGKRVVVPVVSGKDLVVVEYPQKTQQFRRGPLGIMEPSQSTRPIADDEIDCVLVPGVGFDDRGTRLGFGGGYYDRLLRRLPPTVTYGGLAFQCQIVTCIPHMPHDVPMLFVVSEQGVLSWERVLPVSHQRHVGGGG
jgi:5-formyltetrahydrofolate cyclo-ligase